MRKRRYLFLQVYSLLLCLISCHSSLEKRVDHPTIVSAILDSADKISVIDKSQAIRFINKKYGEINNPGIIDLCEKYKFYVVQNQFDRRTLEIAYRYTDSLLNMLKPLAGDEKFQYYLADAYLMRGDMLLKKGFYEKAYQSYFDGRSLVQENDRSREGAVFYSGFYRRIGDIYYEKEMFRESAKWQKKALARLTYEAHQFTQVRLVISTINNIALAFTKAKMIDSAKHYYISGLNFLDAHADSLRKIDFRELKGMLSGNLGEVYKNSSRLDLAEKLFLIDIEANTEGQALNEAGVITSIKLANVYLSQSRMKVLEQTLTKIWKFEYLLTGNDAILQSVLLNARYYEAIGDRKKAIEEYIRYIARRDEFTKAKKRLLESDLIKDLEIFEQASQNDRLNETNRFQFYILILIFILLLCLLLIVFILMRNYQREKENNKVLALFNSKMKTTLSDLNKSNKDNHDLIKMVAHDFKNPIHAIRGISEIMMAMPLRNDEDCRLLNLIVKTSGNLEESILNVLSRNNSQTHCISMGVDFFELVEQSRNLLQFNAAEKKQHIVLKGPVNIYLDIDREKIWRVINNLLTNAIKFSPANSTIAISWVLDAKVLLVSVTDQGFGIPDYLRKNIFDFGTTAGKRGTEGEESHGMGLAISRQIIQEQGGELWLESSSSVGSVFTFSISVQQY